MADYKDLIEMSLEAGDVGQLSALMGAALSKAGFGKFDSAEAIGTSSSAQLVMTLSNGQYLSCTVDVLDNRPPMAPDDVSNVN